MADKEAGVIWTDVNGYSRLSTIRTLGGVGSIEAAIVAVSNADWESCWEGPIDVNVPSVTAAVYQSVQDAAVLSFETASGSIIKLMVPAPLLSIFMADRQTVDATAIAGLIAVCVGNLSDGAGNAAVTYLGGFYQRSGSVIKGG